MNSDYEQIMNSGYKWQDQEDGKQTQDFKKTTFRCVYVSLEATIQGWAKDFAKLFSGNRKADWHKELCARMAKSGSSESGLPQLKLCLCCQLAKYPDFCPASVYPSCKMGIIPSKDAVKGCIKRIHEKCFVQPKKNQSTYVACRRSVASSGRVADSVLMWEMKGVVTLWPHTGGNWLCIFSIKRQCAHRTKSSSILLLHMHSPGIGKDSWTRA